MNSKTISLWLLVAYFTLAIAAPAQERQTQRYFLPQVIPTIITSLVVEIVNQTAVLRWDKLEGFPGIPSYDLLILEYYPDFHLETVAYFPRIKENAVALSGFVPGRYYARVTMRDGQDVIRGRDSQLFKVEAGTKDEASPLVQGIGVPTFDGALRIFLHKRGVVN